MKITVRVSRRRLIAVFQRKAGHGLALGVKGRPHDASRLCHQADPADAVFLAHRMKDTSYLYSHMEPILLDHRQMLFGGTVAGARLQDFKGLAGVGQSRIRGLGQGFQNYDMVLVSEK